MHLSVIFVFASLTTLSTQQTRFNKGADQWLDKGNYQTLPYKIVKPFEQKSLKIATRKLQGSGIRDHHDNNQNYYKILWNRVKILPESSQLRIKNTLNRVLLEEEEFAIMVNEELSNNDVKSENEEIKNYEESSQESRPQVQSSNNVSNDNEKLENEIFKDASKTYMPNLKNTETEHEYLQNERPKYKVNGETNNELLPFNKDSRNQDYKETSKDNGNYKEVSKGYLPYELGLQNINYGEASKGYWPYNIGAQNKNYGGASKGYWPYNMGPQSINYEGASKGYWPYNMGPQSINYGGASKGYWPYNMGPQNINYGGASKNYLPQNPITQNYNYKEVSRGYSP